jgi:hypothetical protein
MIGLLLAFMLQIVPAPVCLMVITCPSVSAVPVPTPTPTPSISPEAAQIAAWNAMTDAERVVFWNALAMPEQKVYYWYALQAPKRPGFCVALSLPTDCIPIPVP